MCHHVPTTKPTKQQLCQQKTWFLMNISRYLHPPITAKKSRTANTKAPGKDSQEKEPSHDAAQGIEGTDWLHMPLVPMVFGPQSEHSSSNFWHFGHVFQFQSLYRHPGIHACAMISHDEKRLDIHSTGSVMFLFFLHARHQKHSVLENQS